MTEEFITDYDIHLFGEGSHYRTYEKLGAHLIQKGAKQGTNFAVWAPNAERVAVVGEFNHWNENVHPMQMRGGSGIWELFIPDVKQGALYKYIIYSHHNGHRSEKADPYGFAAEIRPQTASKVWDLSNYKWQDREWMADRAGHHALKSPISIYEVHLSSWMRIPEEGNRWLTYRELAPKLTEYIKHMGFTHIELLPISEHPFDGSWGYQTVGYFAPTSRFGTPEEFMYFVDYLHQNGIGVLLDWVPAHFPRDAHGLGYFDGTHLYEHADPRQGEHRDWGTFIFNYGRSEVSNFLISNALFWLDKYHLDGLRVDAVASMLYLDYSREEGDWIPNQFGGRENLEAIAFLKRFNEKVYSDFPDVLTMAEESTSWPMVSKPTYLGGLGFGYKWDMGWMHDTLEYFTKDGVYRKFHQDKLTFRMLYAFSENFALPLSHDEVVHGKGSLINKMPGDYWQKFANLRSLLGYMFAQPGKKLLFMGIEFGQWREWKFDDSLDWHLLNEDPHRQLQRFVRDLNTLYRGEAALHRGDVESFGFEWVDCSDAENSVISLLRKDESAEEQILFVFNFTPVPRHDYRLGVNRGGLWREILNSDASIYGGSGVGNMGGVEAESAPSHDRPYSLNLTLPPLGVVAFKP